MKRVLIARPRLDCSFKPGAVPETEGPPRNAVLARFGTFIDNLEAHFEGCGWSVTSDKRPLWQFELGQLQQDAVQFDLVFFPHKLEHQFPIGPNALFYKTTAIPEYLTVDPKGWGASLSFLPSALDYRPEAAEFFQNLKMRIADNQSVFEQPSADAGLEESGYLLFVCQLPHDETIQYHSTVGVEQALAAVIAYAETTGRRLLVKGHPANRKAMAQLAAMTKESGVAKWVDDVSIHTCLAGADRVFMVNSGVGFEAMLHEKTVVHFGDAEYSGVHLRADPEVASIAALETRTVSPQRMAAFLHGFFRHTIRYDDASTYGRVLDPYMA